MNLIINPSQPPGYTRPINNGSTRFVLPIPGRSRLKPELEKTVRRAAELPKATRRTRCPDKRLLSMHTSFLSQMLLRVNLNVRCTLNIKE